ncbi:MAG: DinB family protein [Desulfobacterales bacterium]|nr:DinB family protein [Desulfobacterales bacterium]
MLTELRQQYDQLEDARLALVKKVRELNPKLLRYKPEPERWSILEDLQHMVLAEQKTALKLGTAAVFGEKNPEMLAMVLQVLDQDMVVDVPDPEMVPDGDAALEDLIRNWDQARKDLYRFLSDCGPDDLEAPVSHHVVAGPLTVVECLGLLASHFHHHRRRIEAAIDRR